MNQSLNRSNISSQCLETATNKAASGISRIALLQGLDTDHPEIVFKDGHCWIGEYEESFGSQLFLEEAEVNMTSVRSKSDESTPKVLGISERSIRFKDTAKKPNTAPPR